MSQNDILNCYTDLNRAAASLYLNPSGQNHLIFLNHAIKILKNNQYSQKLKNIKKRLKSGDNKYLAEEILTTGILLKQYAH